MQITEDNSKTVFFKNFIGSNFACCILQSIQKEVNFRMTDRKKELFLLYEKSTDIHSNSTYLFSLLEKGNFPENLNYCQSVRGSRKEKNGKPANGKAF